MKQIRLDDLYHMVANIYYEQNSLRSTAATYAHFVEVCGMLTVHDRKKKKSGIIVETALCKALGWYFPLLAKLKVRSVEELIFRKYPWICPYCREAPHNDRNCKLVRGTEQTVNHDLVRKFYNSNNGRRPVTLNDWQHMFQIIYPRDTEDRGRSTIGLFEEIGELGEAVRVFDRHPKYFAGEAADVFSYLMGIANEHSIRIEQEEERVFSFEDEFLQRYPGLCPQCGFKSCVCPAVPRSTVGRMSKELDIGVAEDLFRLDTDELVRNGSETADLVFDRVGGYSSLTESFPFDRGDANRALSILCLKLASVFDINKPELSDRFRSAALTMSSVNSEAGSPPHSELQVAGLTEAIRSAWRELDHDQKDEIAKSSQHIVANIGAMLGKVRVLFVHACPSDQESIRVSSELRAVKGAILKAGRQDDILVVSLPSATPDDLRRELLSNNYEIIHFSGHSDESFLIFESEEGKSVETPISSISELISKYPTVRCVILNACKSAVELTIPMAPYTIGMYADVDDEGAIEFARGFYDAIAANRDIDFAIAEGKSASEMNGKGSLPIKVLIK